MGYEIDYSGMEAGEAKRLQGIRDMQAYLPRHAFNVLATTAMESQHYGQLSFLCGFAGVSGYPVVALWDETRHEMRSMCE